MILDDEDILIGESISSSVFEPIVTLILFGVKLSEKDFEILSKGDNNYKVKDRNELNKIIDYFIDRKLNTISLNWLDVSNITIMTDIFYGSNFNGDISKWDVSSVEHMSYMFYYSEFNGDISKWDVSNVKGMNSMFAYSEFTSDISKWNVSNVYSMMRMFEESKFNKNISKWDVSNVKYKTNIFTNCPIKEKYKPKFK